MLEINNSNFKEVLGSETKLILIDFWAPWCIPCKVLSPIIEKVAKERETVIVAKVNVDENPELAAELSIRSIPTIVFFKSGKEHSRIIGIKTKEDINAKIDTII